MENNFPAGFTCVSGARGHVILAERRLQVPLDEALVLLVQRGVLLRGQLSGEKAILDDSI